MTNVTKNCAIDGCFQPVHCRQLCNKHYIEQKRRAQGMPTLTERYASSRIFSGEQARLLRQQYETGLTLKLLAERYGGTPPTISSAIRLAGGTIRSKRKRSPTPNPILQQADFSPQKLRAVREKARFTQAELAAKIGCPKPDLIRQWEKGERTPSATYLLRILVACNARAAALLSAPPPAS